VDLNPKYYILPFLKSQIRILRENISKDMLKKLPHIIIHDDFPLENLLFKGDNSINLTKANNIIIMDSDSYFGEGAAELLYEALKTCLVAKDRIIFFE
jgi:choline kinase